MKRCLVSCMLAVLLLSGCSRTGDIPDNLIWQAQTLQSQEDGRILAASDAWTASQELPLLDITAQVEDGAITLTDHTTGEVYSGVLTPMESAAPQTGIYTLEIGNSPVGYAVYGVTEYLSGEREATLYLTVEGKTLCFVAPLP